MEVCRQGRTSSIAVLVVLTRTDFALTHPSGRGGGLQKSSWMEHKRELELLRIRLGGMIPSRLVSPWLRGSPSVKKGWDARLKLRSLQSLPDWPSGFRCMLITQV